MGGGEVIGQQISIWDIQNFFIRIVLLIRIIWDMFHQSELLDFDPLYKFEMTFDL